MSPLDESTANLIYEILRDDCGASEADREDFVWLQTLKHVPEYRFQGNLGFGGKLYLTKHLWHVMCYPEDMTPERTLAIRAANRKLAELKTARVQREEK